MKMNKDAFTLLEIIFASLIFAIVVLGVVTSNIALQKNSKNSADTYFIVQNTTHSTNHILNNAALAVGTIGFPGYAAQAVGGATVDIGHDAFGTVLKSANSGDPDIFCFYQGAVPPANESADYGPWMCYRFSGEKIFYRKATPGDVNAIGTSCNANPCPSSYAYLGNAARVTQGFTIESCSYGDSACNSAQKVLFQITIENCRDTDPANCSSGNPRNPYVVKSGSVSPSAYSAG